MDTCNSSTCCFLPPTFLPSSSPLCRIKREKPARGPSSNGIHDKGSSFTLPICSIFPKMGRGDAKKTPTPLPTHPCYFGSCTILPKIHFRSLWLHQQTRRYSKFGPLRSTHGKPAERLSMVPLLIKTHCRCFQSILQKGERRPFSTLHKPSPMFSAGVNVQASPRLTGPSKAHDALLM